MNLTSKTRSFTELMLNRIHEILLVASPYDAYILEEEGRLTEQILNEYLGMSLRYAPRLWQTSTAAQALDLLTKRKFDLIIVMMRISDMDPITFGSLVKEIYPKKPVILLLFDQSELKQIPEKLPTNSIDRIFIYSGNANVFPAIIKLIEDKLNVKRDTRVGDVRSVIVVEDNPAYYSLFLPMIYKEIVFHTKDLLSKSFDDMHRIIQKRARPKILLASNFEDAKRYFIRYSNNVLGIISDIRFPRNGELDDNAGVKFAKWVRKKDPNMPIILQSTAKNKKHLADEVNAQFLHKHSITLLYELRRFIVNNFGFGNFTFRSPDGKKIGQASNLDELYRELETVPLESLIYHARSNNFSNWLAARGEFVAATYLRQIRVDLLETPEQIRPILLDAINNTVTLQQEGRVVDFSGKSSIISANFMRIRSGSLGGKARGLAFANTMIRNSAINEKFPEVTIRIPKVAVIGTDEFDVFMEKNELWDPMLSLMDTEEINNLFINGDLSHNLIDILKLYLTNTKSPLAVRSSSLLEDAQYNSLSGMYATFMLHNASKDDDERLNQLCEAIKRVYASMFVQQSKSALVRSTHRFESEKMAVIIQEVVGRRYGRRFYPTLSGVAQSINYYPVSYMKRDEGVAYIALGLGRTIAEGERSLRFAPRYPSILPQYFSISSTLQNSQNNFYALTIDPDKNHLKNGESGNLGQFSLKDAEEDGTLKHAASVVCSQDDVIRDALNYEGTRVITFASILKYNSFPLAGILEELLELGSKSLGCPVELEFAVNLPQTNDDRAEFCLLQIKPLPISQLQGSEEFHPVQEEDILCKTDVCLGNGSIQDLHDIVYVKLDNFDPAKTPQIAEDIDQINQHLGIKNPYLLIGPGRWGSADPWLGIPVTWNQISNVKVIVEAGMEDFLVDPSFGSHFFQNVTSMRIGYFTVSYKKKQTDKIDWEWLGSLPVISETEYLVHVHTPRPLRVKMDGLTGKGIVYKPEQPVNEIMDEEESSGI